MKILKIISCCFFSLFCVVFSYAQSTDSTTFNLPDTNSETIDSYTSVHYRGSAMINLNAKPQVFQFSIVCVLDSFLYVQLNIGAIEAGRVLINPDNILLINRLQKNYYQGDYSVFEKLLDMELDFFTLQDIFTGIPIFYPDDLEISYLMDSISYEYPFFSTLSCEYYLLSLKLDVKKVNFNTVPEVSATIPKNFTGIEFNE